MSVNPAQPDKAVQQTHATASATGRNRWRVALGWWVVAGGIGVLLRYQLVYPLPEMVYPFWLHAHSHVVLLGWTFNALFLAVLAAFMPHRFTTRPVYLSWIGFQIAVLGMLVFFPVQGYAAGSIAFSTLHVFLSYYMAWRFRHDLRADQSLSAGLLRWGLFFLVLSTLGPYALGILKARHLQETNWYNLAIYFYLHFLYNGWFVFGCLALLFRWLEGWGIAPADQDGKRFLTAFTGATFGTLALSALWTQPPVWVWLVGGLAGLVQAAAGGWLLYWLWRHRARFRTMLRVPALALARLALLSFALKLLLQTLSALPPMAEWAYTQRHLVIAYLHLVFIGLVSFFLLAWASQHRLLAFSRLSLWLLVGFFTLMELGLVAESLLQRWGSYLPYFGETMLVLSVGLWLGVAAALLSSSPNPTDLRQPVTN